MRWRLPGGSANSGFKNFLLPFDLTRGGALFPFNGRTDIKELALYIQDTITKGNWSFNLGIRGDLYNGFASARQAEPRLGIAYNIKPSNTVLRVSYARTLETPFNENLVIASTGCQSQVLAAIVPPPGVSCNLGAIQPGWRNEFHGGLQQAFGSHFVVDGEYIWKYTHNGYDFGVVGATPITFPIEWHNSKISGFTVRANVPNYRGLSAFVSMSSVAARFFLPQVGRNTNHPSFNGGFPHRSRREIQRDDTFAIPAVEERAVDRIQLAIRQRARCRCHSVLQPSHRNLPAVVHYSHRKWTAGTSR